MAIDLASLLSGNNLDTLYRNDDPYYQAARGIAGIQTTAPRSNTEAFLLPFLQNTLAGGLAGYGKENARQTQYQDISSMLSSMGYQPSSAKDPYAMAAEAGSIANLLGSDDISSSMYGQAVAPEGFSGKIGMADLLLATSQKQAEQEAAAKYQELQDKLNIESSQPYLEMIRKQEEAKASGKTAGEGVSSSNWWKDVPATDKSKLTQAKGVISQLDKLAQDFEIAGMSAAEFRSKMDISGTKANELKSRMMTLIPNTVRLMGDVGNLNEGEQQRVIDATLGNFTSGTEGAAQRIKNLADQSQGIVQSKLEGFKLAQTDPSSLLERGSPNSTDLKQSMIPEGAVPTGETSKGKPVYIINGVKGVLE